MAGLPMLKKNCVNLGSCGYPTARISFHAAWPTDQQRLDGADRRAPFPYQQSNPPSVLPYAPSINRQVARVRTPSPALFLLIPWRTVLIKPDRHSRPAALTMAFAYGGRRCTKIASIRTEEIVEQAPVTVEDGSASTSSAFTSVSPKRPGVDYDDTVT